MIVFVIYYEVIICTCGFISISSMPFSPIAVIEAAKSYDWGLCGSSNRKNGQKKENCKFSHLYVTCSSILGGTVTIEHEKGVRIVFCLILKSGLRITYSTDKTIAPHRFCYIICHSRQGISNRCRCYCQPYLRGNSNLRSLTLEDKISITPL